MFFPDKIVSIRPTDKVLEIGPGSSPHPRSNAFLELAFDSESTRLAQRGMTSEEPNFGGRPIYYYSGDRFPFEDDQFDYVICSHVIEHVHDPEAFMREVFRVGSQRGYIEYPLMTYEYLYDFDVHLHFLKYDADTRTLRYLPKQETPFVTFSATAQLFRQSLAQGWDDLCAPNKKVFFEGFEYEEPFVIKNRGPGCAGAIGYRHSPQKSCPPCLIPVGGFPRSALIGEAEIIHGTKHPSATTPVYLG